MSTTGGHSGTIRLDITRDGTDNVSPSVSAIVGYDMDQHLAMSSGISFVRKGGHERPLAVQVEKWLPDASGGRATLLPRPDGIPSASVVGGAPGEELGERLVRWY